jgi:exoribonuclease II
VQVTSPIRRFADMIAHRQIKAHLTRNTQPYARETLAEAYLPHIQQRYLTSIALRAFFLPLFVASPAGNLPHIYFHLASHFP